MALAAADMQQLRKAVDALDPANPHYARFFREALVAARRRREPLDALELLAALGHSPHAAREPEQQALAAALQWTSQRLRQDPGLDLERFCGEIGWLVRLLRSRPPPAFERGAPRWRPEPRAEAPARDRDAPRGRAQGGGGHAGGAAGGRAAGPRSGTQNRGRGAQNRPTAAPQALPMARLLEQIAAARQRARAPETPPHAQAGASSRPRPAGSSPAAASPPAPPALPAVFSAEFSSVQEAREARRIARKRAKEGRPAKEARIALRAADPALRSLRIAVSSTRTDGLERVFDAMDARAGQIVRFVVAATEAQPDGTQLATRVSLEE